MDKSRDRFELIHHMLANTSFQNYMYYSDQIMEVEAMNLTSWYLAQKLVCLEDIQEANLTLSVHRRKVPLISDFYNHWRRTLLSSILVACELHTVETWTGTAGRLRTDVRSNHCYPKALSKYFFSRRQFEYISTSFSHTFAICYF